jgi:penicillin-binding protein 2
VPSSEWKLREKREKWYPGETISVAIGQGFVDVTPLSQAVMMMTVANGGTRFTPHVLKAVYDAQGETWKPVAPPPPQSVAKMKNSTIDALHEGLWLVVNGSGTGGRSRIPGYNVAGKTGTAQVISLTGRRWPRKDRRAGSWVVRVLRAARQARDCRRHLRRTRRARLSGAPIAKYAMETYFAKKEGRPLPTLQKPAAPIIAATTPQ